MNSDRLSREISHILRAGGLFFAISYYLMPIGDYELEQSFFDFTKAVNAFVQRSGTIVQPFKRETQEQHIENMVSTDEFKFAHKISFSSRERFSVERFIALALSQGKVYNSFQHADALLMEDYAKYCTAVETFFQNRELDLDISYSLIIRING